MLKKAAALLGWEALVAFILTVTLLVLINVSCENDTKAPTGYDRTLAAAAVDVNPDPPKCQNQYGIIPVGELISWSSVMGGAPNCVIYEHDGERTLALTHTYTARTCCAFDMWVDFTFEDDVITKVEYDQPGFYYAFSRYELNMEITNLRPQVYTFVITNRYLSEPIEFAVDLAEEPSGFYCID